MHACRCQAAPHRPALGRLSASASCPVTVALLASSSGPPDIRTLRAASDHTSAAGTPDGVPLRTPPLRQRMCARRPPRAHPFAPFARCVGTPAWTTTTLLGGVRLLTLVAQELIARPTVPDASHKKARDCATAYKSRTRLTDTATPSLARHAGVSFGAPLGARACAAPRAALDADRDHVGTLPPRRLGSPRCSCSGWRRPSTPCTRPRGNSIIVGFAAFRAPRPQGADSAQMKARAWKGTSVESEA